MTEQDLIVLRNWAEQQKIQRAIKIRNKLSIQTLDINIAGTLSPVSKTTEQADKPTENLGEIKEESNSGNDNNQHIVLVEIDSEDDDIQSNTRALPNSNKFSCKMTETLGALMNSENYLKLLQDDSGRASILGIPINTLSGDTIQINDIIYTLTPDIYKTSSSTWYTGKSKKNENDILMINII